MNFENRKCGASNTRQGQGWCGRHKHDIAMIMGMALISLLSNRSFARVVSRQCVHPDGIRDQLLGVIKLYDEDSVKGAQHLRAMAERCLRIGWQRRAQTGCPYGQVLLGLCLENGAGIEQDHEAAVAWYRKSLPKDQETDPFRLMDDRKKAVAAFAQYRLGEAYLLGKGVERDEPQAMVWFREAANNGCQQAIKTLKGMDDAIEATGNERE